MYRTAAFFSGLMLLSGCSGVQSVLAPHGPNAGRVLTLGGIMTAGAAGILIFVILLTAYAMYASPERRRRLASQRLVFGAGIVFPVATLTALLAYGLSVGARVTGLPEPTLKIEIVGEQWWWRVRYLDAEGKPVLVTANEVRLPIGEPAELALSTADVIHSFWVPNIAGKLDMIPGRVNRLRVMVDEAGTFRGQCAEYCGAQHALMAFHVVAMTEDDFRLWLEAQQQPAKEPGTSKLKRGRELFIANGCGACHTVRGTHANGIIGPDLTHVGSRLSIAAGTLRNDAPSFAAWIAGSQHIKPENRMPSFDIFEGGDLDAVADYLESLE